MCQSQRKWLAKLERGKNVSCNFRKDHANFFFKSISITEIIIPEWNVLGVRGKKSHCFCFVLFVCLFVCSAGEMRKYSLWLPQWVQCCPSYLTGCEIGFSWATQLCIFILDQCPRDSQLPPPPASSSNNWQDHTWPRQPKMLAGSPSRSSGLTFSRESISLIPGFSQASPDCLYKIT